MRGHVDPEALAAFREDLLPRRKARQVTAHLAECPRCAGLDAQLAGLPALLAHTPAPPMPDALTARIEAALAAEAAARSGEAPAGVPGTEAPAGTPADGPRDAGAPRGGRRRVAAPGRHRLALPIAVAAAAVVIIAGGGYGVSRLLSGGAAPSPSSAPALGPGVARPESSATASPPVNGPDHRSAAAGAAYPVVASGTNYRASALKTQVRATLIRFGAAVPAAPAGAARQAPAVAGLAPCLAHVTGGHPPRLVDLARYEGRPAAVVVLPAGARTLRVLVIGRPCSAGNGLLASTVVPSPG